MNPVILTCPYCGHNVPMPKGAIASDCHGCGKAVFRPLRSVEILQKFGHGVQSTKTDPRGTPGAGVHEPPTMPTGAEVSRECCGNCAHATEIIMPRRYNCEESRYHGLAVQRLAAERCLFKPKSRYSARPIQELEYIITEFQLNQIRQYADLDFICQAIQSRPLGMVGARGAASDAPVGAVSEDQTPAPGG